MYFLLCVMVLTESKATTWSHLTPCVILTISGLSYLPRTTKVMSLETKALLLVYIRILYCLPQVTTEWGEGLPMTNTSLALKPGPGALSVILSSKKSDQRSEITEGHDMKAKHSRESQKGNSEPGCRI